MQSILCAKSHLFLPDEGAVYDLIFSWFNINPLQIHTGHDRSMSHLCPLTPLFSYYIFII